MANQPEIRQLTASPAAVSRAVCAPANLKASIDSGFGTLFARLAKLGVEPAEAPYIRYLKTGEQFEIELGVPVSAGSALQGLEEATLPQGRAAVLRHVGPYEDLRGACEQLLEWVTEHGESPSGPHWESYVTNPAAEPDPAKRITDIYMPLR